MKSRRGKSTYECAACEQYVPDRHLFVVVNKTSGERMALHRLCAQHLIATMNPPSARAVRRAVLAQAKPKRRTR